MAWEDHMTNHPTEEWRPTGSEHGDTEAININEDKKNFVKAKYSSKYFIIMRNKTLVDGTEAVLSYGEKIRWKHSMEK